MKQEPENQYSRRLRRFFDVTLGAAMAVSLAPVMGSIALAIMLESGRPVLFRQQRAGLKARPFTLLKFRSLCRVAHDIHEPDRIATRTGRLLRRWGLDELPQLWNVLRGEMSLVGPRPTLLEHVARYGPYERRRLDVKPGLTGWAQIHGRNALTWEERIHLDVWYVDHRSLRLDLKILLRTPGALFRGKGVHGPDGRNSDFTGQTRIDPGLAPPHT